MSKIPFTVSAKTARLIGQENFSNAEGAVIELVKNAYDADATVCIVFIDTAHDNLYIIDNGDGMTDKIVRESWMIIGTDDKVDTIKSKNNRVKTGAKGIGRFAMDRLGYRTQLYSKMKNTEGVSWFIDWKQFEQKKKTINDIKAELETVSDLNLKEDIKVIFNDFDLDSSFFDYWQDNKGTIIKISALKDGWIGYKHDNDTLENVITENLFRHLEDLIPPLENDFLKIYLFHSEFKDKYGEVTSSQVEDYDYKIRLVATRDQRLTVTIWQNEVDLKIIKQLGFFEKTKLAKQDPNYSLTAFEKGYFEINKAFDELLGDEPNLLETYPKIGSFEAILYFLKRGGGEEREDSEDNIYHYRKINYELRRKWLAKFGGIKLYRDNFKVRPLGDPKGVSFDWIGLISRSARSSSIKKGRWRISDRQVYGVVKITRLDNPYFEDKSDREGIKENDVFKIFRQVLLAGIDIFEGERTAFFRALHELYDINNPNAKAIKREEQIRKDRQTKQNSKNTEGEENSNLNNDNSNSLALNNNIDNDTDVLLKVIDTERKEKEEVIEGKRILQALASTGLLVTSFAHDFENLSGNLVSRAKKLKRSIEPLIDKKVLKELQDYENPFVKIEQMRQDDEKLSKWLDFAISTVKGGKRRKRDVNLEKYFESLQSTWNPQFEARQVNFVCSPMADIYLNLFEIDLDSIFVNLFANSIEAFSRREAGNQRLIKIQYGKIENTIFIDYEDSGPGLDNTISDPNRIFDMFFSTRKDPRTNEQIGTGLGMYILKSAVENYQGSVEILEHKTKYKMRMLFPIKNSDDV